MSSDWVWYGRTQVHVKFISYNETSKLDFLFPSVQHSHLFGSVCITARKPSELRAILPATNGMCQTVLSTCVIPSVVNLRCMPSICGTSCWIRHILHASFLLHLGSLSAVSSSKVENFKRAMSVSIKNPTSDDKVRACLSFLFQTSSCTLTFGLVSIVIWNCENAMQGPEMCCCLLGQPAPLLVAIQQFCASQIMLL